MSNMVGDAYYEKCAKCGRQLGNSFRVKNAAGLPEHGSQDPACGIRTIKHPQPGPRPFVLIADRNGNAISALEGDASVADVVATIKGLDTLHPKSSPHKGWAYTGGGRWVDVLELHQK